MLEEPGSRRDTNNKKTIRHMDSGNAKNLFRTSDPKSRSRFLDNGNGGVDLTEGAKGHFTNEFEEHERKITNLRERRMSKKKKES